MDSCKVDLNTMEWQSPLPGAKFKAFEKDNRKLRLVEFTKDFIEPDWCVKGHIGYVLDGEMEINFDGEPVRCALGQQPDPF